jgi:hypothetical protein
VLELLTGAACRPRDDGYSRGIHRQRAANGEIGVGGSQVAAGHDQQFVHVRRAGNDRLGAGDDDSPGLTLDNVQVGVGVRLLVGSLRAVALGVGHGDSQRQVARLHLFEVSREARPMFAAAARIVDAGADLMDRVQRVVRQIALRAAGLLTQDAHRLELVQQVAGRFVDVQHAIDGPAAAACTAVISGDFPGIEREIVGDCQGVDSRLQRAGHRRPRFDQPDRRRRPSGRTGAATRGTRPR